jgi:maltose/moltooligosaccharide transporter
MYNGFAAAVAFLLPVMAKATSRKTTHAISLIAGGLGLISIYFISNPNMLLLSMVGVGMAWASILSMPYAILAGSLPSSKMGTYMGIFNFFIVIPQILAASLLGFFTKYLFGGEAIYALILGGVSMIVAAAMVFFVTDRDDVK